MLLSSVVQQEVENLGYVTKYDSSTWAPSSIPSIIKNEKYKDDYCWVTPLQLTRLPDDDWIIWEKNTPARKDVKVQVSYNKGKIPSKAV
ncbi:hypothetical protein JCM11672_24250 [Alkaliphilus crotonatoxidans]